VLVRPSTPDGWVPVCVDAERRVVPLRFSVNRCDPHAVAEVTKRFGLDVEVVVGGADPASVTVDVTPIEPQLEAIVAACRAALAPG
jgi:hypothetical protein